MIMNMIIMMMMMMMMIIIISTIIIIIIIKIILSMCCCCEMTKEQAMCVIGDILRKKNWTQDGSLWNTSKTISDGRPGTNTIIARMVFVEASSNLDRKVHCRNVHQTLL